MKKFIITAVALLLILFFVWYGKKLNNAPDDNFTDNKPIVKIGINLPLSGNLSDSALRAKCAAEMALAEEEEKGSLKHTYQLIIEDDGLNIRNVNNIANKFINIDKVGALVSFFGGQVVAGYAEKAKVPHFSALADPELALKNHYTFTDWVLPDEYAVEMVKHLKARGIKSAALLSLNHQGGDAIVRSLAKELGHNEIKITDNDKFSEDEKFFRAILEKQISHQPDTYIILAFPPAIDLIGRDAKNLGITSKLTSIESFGYTENRELFEGQEYLSVSRGNNDFKNRFRKFCGKELLHGNNYVYDMTKLAILSVEKGMENLKNHEYNFSMPIYIDENKIIHSSPVMRKIKNGKITDLEKR